MADHLDIRKELEAVQREGTVTSREFAENLVRQNSPEFIELFIQACVDQGIISTEFVEAVRNKYANAQDNNTTEQEGMTEHEADDDESQGTNHE